MEQAFNDLLTERAREKNGLHGFAVWIFAETFTAIVGENMTVIKRQNRGIFRIALVAGLILLLPLIAMQFTDEVNWSLGDFIIAFGLLFGAGLTYQLIARKAEDIFYRTAVGIAVGTALFLVWANLAVGIIGNENNPANLMYYGVLAVGIIGAVLARFQPRGMALALVATAVAQTLVTVIALIAGLTDSMGTLLITAIFLVLWLASAWLFRKSGEEALRRA